MSPKNLTMKGAQYPEELVYQEIRLEDRKWMTAIRTCISEDMPFDYGLMMARRLVAHLWTYLREDSIRVPKTWWDHWKIEHPKLTEFFRLRPPRLITFECRAVFPELHVLEGKHKIMYPIYRPTEDFEEDE